MTDRSSLSYIFIFSKDFAKNKSPEMGIFIVFPSLFFQNQTASCNESYLPKHQQMSFLAIMLIAAILT